MNRRNFLSWLGTGLAVGTAATVLPLEQLLAYNPKKTYFDMGSVKGDWSGGWVSYKFHYTVLPPPYTYYNKRFIDNLKAQFPFVELCKVRSLPMNTGYPIKFFTYKSI